MFWDKVSPLYDFFENVYNGKVYSGTGAKVAEMIEPSDYLLECACGTGAITQYLAPKCRKMIATDGKFYYKENLCSIYLPIRFTPD